MFPRLWTRIFSEFPETSSPVEAEVELLSLFLKRSAALPLEIILISGEKEWNDLFAKIMDTILPHSWRYRSLYAYIPWEMVRLRLEPLKDDFPLLHFLEFNFHLLDSPPEKPTSVFSNALNLKVCKLDVLYPIPFNLRLEGLTRFTLSCTNLFPYWEFFQNAPNLVECSLISWELDPPPKEMYEEPIVHKNLRWLRLSSEDADGQFVLLALKLPELRRLDLKIPMLLDDLMPPRLSHLSCTLEELVLNWADVEKEKLKATLQSLPTVQKLFIGACYTSGAFLQLIRESSSAYTDPPFLPNLRHLEMDLWADEDDALDIIESRMQPSETDIKRGIIPLQYVWLQMIEMDDGRLSEANLERLQRLTKEGKVGFVVDDTDVEPICLEVGDVSETGSSSSAGSRDGENDSEDEGNERGRDEGDREGTEESEQEEGETEEEGVKREEGEEWGHQSEEEAPETVAEDVEDESEIEPHGESKGGGGTGNGNGEGCEQAEEGKKVQEATAQSEGNERLADARRGDGDSRVENQSQSKAEELSERFLSK